MPAAVLCFACKDAEESTRDDWCARWKSGDSLELTSEDNVGWMLKILGRQFSLGNSHTLKTSPAVDVDDAISMPMTIWAS